MAEKKQEVQSCPSYNPADLTTTAGMLDYIYRCNSMSTDNCMPAIVESYDRKKNIVTVKPCINITAATGETIERESITATVLSICGAKFIINFPLEKGDTGWLITADRDISLFREQRKIINANTNRIHSIEDSFFIPDRVNDFKVEAEDEKNLVIQNLDRNIRISMAQDKIKITTKTKPKEKEDGKENGEGTESQDGVSTNNVSSTDGTSEASNSKEQSDTTTISLTEGEVEVETTGKVTVKANKNVSCTVEEKSSEDSNSKSDSKSDSKKEKNTTKVFVSQEEVNVETTGKVTVKSKKNVSCTVEEGDIECKCKNLTSTVEKDIKCTCENLTAEVKKDCTIKADGNANIKAPNIKLEGEVSIQGNVSISGNVSVSGNESISGNVDVSGNVTASDCIGGGKSLAGHIHQGVHGPTGGPQ